MPKDFNEELESTLDEVFGTPLPEGGDNTDFTMSLDNTLDNMPEFAPAVQESVPAPLGSRPTSPIEKAEAEARKAGGNVLKRATDAMRAFGGAVDAPRKYFHAAMSRKQDWLDLIPATVLEPNSPEGIHNQAAFPHGQQINMREQAVMDVVGQAVTQAGRWDEFQSIMHTAGPAAAMGWVSGLEAKGELTISEDEITKVEMDLTERGEQEWFRFTIKIAEDHPVKSLNDATNLYLEQHGHSEQAQEVVQRVNKINAAKGVDMTKDTATDVIVQQGIHNLGGDLMKEWFEDPLLVASVLPTKTVRIPTFLDRARKVGIIPSLSNKLDEIGKLDTQLSGLDLAASRARAKTAANVRTTALSQMDEAADPAILRDATKRSALQDEVTMTARDKLIQGGVGASDADEILARAYNSKPKSMLKFLEKAGFDEDQAKLIQAHALAPVNAFNTALKQDEIYRASTTGIMNRHSALKDRYRRALSERDALRHESIEQIMDLTMNPLKAMKAGKVLTPDPKSIGTVAEEIRSGLGYVVPFTKKAKIFKELTGYYPYLRDGMTRRTMLSAFGKFFEPKIMLGGSESWRVIKKAISDESNMTRTWTEELEQHFGKLLDNPELDSRLAMALDSQLVETLPDGTRRYLYRAVDTQTGKLARSESVMIRPGEEQVMFDEARTWFDGVAKRMTSAGVEGFDEGAPILSYFPRVYGDDIVRMQGKDTYIPPEFIDFVSPNIYFKHLLERDMALPILSGELPTLTGAFKSYVPGAARKLALEPALKEGSRAAKFLNKEQQKYWGDYKKVLRGQPLELEKTVDAIIQSGLDGFRRVGVLPARALQRRPTYRTSLALSRAMHRSILGGMVSSAAYNMGQTINTASRFGPFHAMRGFTFHLTKEGRALYNKQGLMTDFVEFFQRPNAEIIALGKTVGANWRTWDDAIMHPMHAAENLNRGIAFGAGISAEMERVGIRSFDDFLKLPPVQQQKILLGGVDAVETTQFIYGRAGQAPFFQQAVGSNMTTLLTFPVKEAEFLAKQMKDDPSGIMRFLVMSGFLTRLNKEALGLNTEFAFGFGFIPESFDRNALPIPMSPEMTMTGNLIGMFMEKDPFRRKQIANQFYSQMGQMASGLAMGRVGPAALLLAVPGGSVPAPEFVKDLTGMERLPLSPTPGEAPHLEQAGEIPIGPLGSLPEIETDMGSRFGTRILRFMRETASMEVRSANESLIRPTDHLNAVQGLAGFQPIETKEGFETQEQTRGLEKHVDFQLAQTAENMAVRMRHGDTDGVQKLLSDLIDRGILQTGEVLDLPSLQARILRARGRQEISAILRSVRRRPGTLATGSGERLQEQMRSQ